METILSPDSHTAFLVKEITVNNGSFREKEIFNNPHYLIQGHTWNNDHRVVSVISTETDKDGHSNSYDVDIVTGRICG